MDLRRYSERQQFHTGVIPTLLEEYLDSNSWNTMLEVGCGDGSLLATLKNLGLVDRKVVPSIGEEGEVRREVQLDPALLRVGKAVSQ